MPEMPRAGKRHRHSARIRRCDNFRVLHRTARLNCRRCASFRRRDETVRKWEKCVTANHAARKRQFGFARFPNRDAAGIHATHLPRTRAQRATFTNVKNRV